MPIESSVDCGFHLPEQKPSLQSGPQIVDQSFHLPPEQSEPVKPEKGK